MLNIEFTEDKQTILNIVNNKSIPLITFIKALEQEIRIEDIKRFLEIQSGDFPNALAEKKITFIYMRKEYIYSPFRGDKEIYYLV